MSAKSKKPRRAGHSLTVKDLPADAYNAIHMLPRGWKYKTLVALLQAAARISKSDKRWYEGKLAVKSYKK